MARVHQVSWIVLAVLALAYVALLTADYRYYYAPLLPIDLLSLALFYLPWWLGWLPLLGCWLVMRAWSVGGGRWGWRWGLGGLLVAGHLWFFGSSLYDFAAELLGPDRGPVIRDAPYRDYKDIVITLALAPVAVLTRGWRRGAPPQP